jgi:hypothetical protein
LLVPAQLQLGHWYDIVLHIVWSPSATTGLFEWCLDGTRVASMHRPTLWQRPTARTDRVELELNNYRQHANWNPHRLLQQAQGRIEPGSGRLLGRRAAYAPPTRPGTRAQRLDDAERRQVDVLDLAERDRVRPSRMPSRNAAISSACPFS